jgi:hypothetical protein
VRYINVNLQERLQKDMISFEVECDSKSHLYRHCASHFDLLWRLARSVDEVSRDEGKAKDRLRGLLKLVE